MSKLAALAAVAVGAALTACGGGSTEATTEEVNEDSLRVDLVRVTPIVTQEIDRKVEYTANLEANDQVFFAPSLAGSRIRKIHVDVGDPITKGQVLVEMDDNNLVQQQLQLKNLEIEYNRAKKLKETGSISDQNYEQVETQYTVTKTAIETLKENTRLIAPFNGVVTGKFMEEGELYTGGAFGGALKPSILSIENITPMKAIVNVSEQYFREIKKGFSVELSTDVYPGRTFPGKVSIVYPSVDPRTRTFSVELIFENPKYELRPGMYGTILFSVAKAKVQIVQSMAVLKVQGSNDRYVFLVRDGKAVRQTVKIVTRYDDKVEIIPVPLEDPDTHEPMIKEGDLLVTTGQGNCKDGRRVKIADPQY